MLLVSIVDVYKCYVCRACDIVQDYTHVLCGNSEPSKSVFVHALRAVNYCSIVDAEQFFTFIVSCMWYLVCIYE